MLSENLISDMHSLSQNTFSATVVHQAKRCLIDYIGATLAGAIMSRTKSLNLLEQFGGMSSDAVIIGLGRRTSLMNAVFINGINSHIAELDDGVRFGQLHPGSPIISALLPVAEKNNLPGERLLIGIIVGYEVAIRLACSMQPSHYNRGFHPTGTCGAIGAAVGIAAMLNFSKTQMKAAFSTAAVAATGTLKVLEDSSELKPFNVAHAAKTGFISASAAIAQFTGPENVLEGNFGFLAMMADTLDASKLESHPAGRLGIESVYVKPYAACRHAHPSIEAAIKIRSRGLTDSSSIRAAKVTTYKSVIGIHDHSEVSSINSAKMSIPFSIAVALFTGKAGIQEFTDEQINDPRIVELAKKIQVQSDDIITALVPQKRCAILEVETVSGQRFSERVDLPKGEPETALTDDELKRKFISLALYSGWSANRCEGLLSLLWDIENQLPRLYARL